MPSATGIVYLAAWAIGLALWPTNLPVDASDRSVITAYSGHRGVAAAQYLLVEGLAAIALAVVVLAVGRAVDPSIRGRRGHVAVYAGIGAAIVSLIECALGLILIAASTSGGNVDRAGVLFDLINRLDGAKMLALSAMAVAAVGLAHRDGLLPRWLGNTAAGLAATMTVSGIGYLLLNHTLAQTAAASLPLLLIWVAGAGVAIGRPDQPAARPNRTETPPLQA